jgi:hypothetical protein
MEKASPQPKPKGSHYFRKSSSAPDFFLPQAKMEVNEPDDAFEQEADAAAEQVVARKPVDSAFFGSTSLMRETDEGEESIQSKADGAESLGKEEEVPVQRDVEEPQETPIEPTVQRESSEEEEAIQTKGEGFMEADEQVQQEEEEEPVQASASSGGPVSPSVEQGIQSTKGSGSPLGSSEKHHMEQSFGADFGGVAIHTDSRAVQMSRELGAKAFTHGNDIYFNEGNYNPGSKDGQRLLAHELTHTLQQGASVRRLVQKDDADTPNNTVTNHYVSEDGELDLRGTSKLLKIKDLPLPGFKKDAGYHKSVPFRLPPKSERNTDQRNKWDTHIRQNETGITEKLDEILSAQIPAETGTTTEPRYYLKLKSVPYNLIGTKSELKNRILRPFWDSAGAFQGFHVDHKTEIQLGGDDDIPNYWLLDEKSNVDSGRLIKTNKDNQIKKVLDGAKQSNIFDVTVPSAVKDVRGDDFTVMVENVSSDPTGFTPKTIDVSEALAGTGVEGLEALTSEELIALRGSPNEIVLFFNSLGGVSRKVPWETDMTQKTDMSDVGGGATIGSNFQLTAINYTHGQGGSITGRAFQGNKFVKDKDLTIDLVTSPIVEYGGVVSGSSLRNEANKLIAEHLSPIEFSQVDFIPEKGIYAVGVIKASLPVIEDVEIDILIDGNSVRISKTFNTGEFKVPSPFQVKNSSLTVFAGTEGLGIEGQIDFGIENVGEGYIGASASTSGGFELAGKFNFDSQLFDPAEINVEYKDNVWTIGGTIGIPAGKVRGVKNATITATYTENTFSAEGDADLDLPGIEKGSMSVAYGAAGFSIGGNFAISGDVPGIRGGTVEARVSKSNDEEGYSVFVSGTAQPDIPGVNSTLSVTYENGALTIMGNAAYSRGMLSGSLEVGATNRTIGEDGQPSGDPDDTMRVFGGGTLTLQLTPWLAATAGVKFLPNGEMEVTARLATDTYDVFPRKEYTKNLFRAPTIEIPLFAIPLGPRSLGLVAQISGGLDFKAGFGPGQLRNLSAEITYNPDHEEETSVRGSGSFVIPADAGLTLRGDLGLGISVAIASLSGGIEIAGTLGLEGEAAAGVDVNWTPQSGLTLDARGSVMVNPKFTFDINAFARASLGIGWFSISETWRHNLASFNWGPDIQFGIVFPVHYEEGEPFDMSLDDIQVIYPDIQVVDTAVGLARSIKNDLFG